LQTHHSVGDSQVNSTFSVDKEVSSLQNYHPSLIESYREKFLLNHDPKMADANSFLHKLNPSVFPLNPLHGQYSKNINLNSLHDSLSRVQTSIDEQQQQQQQTMRVKNLYCLTGDALNKQVAANSDAQASSSFKLSNSASSSIPNDKNNNKNNHSNSFKDKPEPHSHPHETISTEKSSHIIHLNTKTGVSLKCAYCEAREDFKSR
jgi:hypothetical protein